MKKQAAGFTIVELLIVIVVIGILAAITIVAYNGIQERARVATVTADLSGAAKQLAVFEVDAGSYPATLAEVNSGQGIKASSGTTYQYTASGSTYCLTATKGTTSYKISNTATAPTAGGCAGHGVGGVAPITNLALNPSLETNGTGWSERWYGAGGGAGTLSRTNLAALYGNYGYRKTWTTAGGGQDIGMQYIQAVTAGKTYSFSAYVRASVVTTERPFIQWKDAANATIGSSINGTEFTPAANAWQRMAVSATAPAGATSVTFVWGPYPASGSPTAIVGQTVDFDGLMVTESAVPQTYADGSSTDWAWNGTANASTSTGPPL
jgi:prepilin-type N-terminal cleavage/methylation domain-containing protein